MKACEGCDFFGERRSMGVKCPSFLLASLKELAIDAAITVSYAFIPPQKNCNSAVYAE